MLLKDSQPQGHPLASVLATPIDPADKSKTMPDDAIDDILQYQPERLIMGDQLSNTHPLTQHVSTMLIESQVGGDYDDEDALVLMGDDKESSIMIATPKGKGKAKAPPCHSDEIDIDNGLLQQYEHVMNFGQASLNVIHALKTHLRQEYSWYSKKEIEQMVYKFLNEYLAKLQLLTAGQSSEGDSTLIQGEDNTNEKSGLLINQSLHSSTSSVPFDFSDKELIERQIMLQLKLQ